jgi:hypothetical protein
MDERMEGVEGMWRVKPFGPQGMWTQTETPPYPPHPPYPPLSSK